MVPHLPHMKVIVCVLVVGWVPLPARADGPPAPATGATQPSAAQNKATLQWVLDREVPTGGFAAMRADAKNDTAPVASLRATSSAVRAIKYLGGEVPHRDKHAAFVLSCFDPKTGGFAEPGGKPDVASTSIGIMAAVELAIPKEKYAKAMDYLHENAKTFEEVRIGAAAVEAWGVKDCPFKLKDWNEIAQKHIAEIRLFPREGGAREYASSQAMILRLMNPALLETVTGSPITNGIANTLLIGQRDDGGWSKPGEKGSDIETTYRVMRALMLMEKKPKNIPALRKFVESHRNADGGYAIKPGDPSNTSGVYYATIIAKWLDAMEKPAP